MAIAVCTYCGGLVLIRATMCPHCGQRGEATPSRRKVSTFGAKKELPIVVRRLIVCAIVGTGAVFCLALANWIRPVSRHPIEEVTSECDSIRESGEEIVGELDKCEARLAQLRAAERR
ncbi:MAG TPA: hypothetical protein VGP25_03010 [Gemmatimonadaceae bacterium]|jgi:hypothetical protein|nr:hypothetical protein [Gemmatimonadaceae bacterium]